MASLPSVVATTSCGPSPVGALPSTFSLMGSTIATDPSLLSTNSDWATDVEAKTTTMLIPLKSFVRFTATAFLPYDAKTEAEDAYRIVLDSPFRNSLWEDLCREPSSLCCSSFPLQAALS